MTALQLNADIYRSLGVIAQDETALTKVSKYLRRVARNISDYPGAESGNTAATYGTWEAVPVTLREQIDAARAESANGETVVCHGKEGVQRYLDSL